MAERFDRTKLLIGEEGLRRLQESHVAVFGIGGVGGYVCETLMRSGVGSFTLVDKDVVDITNLNRQIIATEATIGRAKTEVMRERILSVFPTAQVYTKEMFFLPENADEIDFSVFSYVIDCVDTVSAKIELIVRAKAAGVPVISAMGAGNKLEPSRFLVADISKTKVCPLARVMRRELKNRGIEHVKTVYSEELPVLPNGGRVPGSIAVCPAVAGMLIAGEVLRELRER